jgi:hypothetical protein
LAADLLLLVPHLAAVLLALRKQPLWSGMAAGVGFLFNTKSVFVLAACALFSGFSGWLPLALGFAVPNAIALGWIWQAGAFPDYIDQVWRWPAKYAASPVVSDPVRNGLLRTLNWLGFHAVLTIGAAICWWRERQWRWMAWALLAMVGVALGWRFFPRYFFLLLPALVIPAASVWARRPRALAVAGVLLLFPLIRFAPRYVSLEGWSDLALDEDSRAAARVLAPISKNATLYVWGYRPEIFVYSGMKPATKYLECQALTGVPADRHLTQSTVVLSEGASAAREELVRAMPDVVVDGLSLYNPALSMDRYPELKPWLGNYHEIGRTRGTVIYLKKIFAGS